CLPFDHPATAFHSGRAPDGSFVFASESNDLRSLETLLLRPDQVQGFTPLGPVAGVVAVVVGFGSNYLNVLACENRLILNNGHHRAYALRELGVTHIPCVLQKLANRDDLKRVAAGGLLRHPERYLEPPRPPLFKDYFDPNLRRFVRLLPRKKYVTVKITV